MKKSLRVGLISLGFPSAKRLSMVVGIGLVILLCGFAVSYRQGMKQGRPPSEEMHTRLLLTVFGSAGLSYETKYGGGAPVDPKKLLAVMRGENVDLVG